MTCCGCLSTTRATLIPIHTEIAPRRQRAAR
jgi:hypothetical protein